MTYSLKFSFEAGCYNVGPEVHAISHKEFWGERTSKCPTREVCERSGVFILYIPMDKSNTHQRNILANYDK